VSSLFLPPSLSVGLRADSKSSLCASVENFDNKSSNNVYWSPKGRHVLLATLGSNSKFDIEFWDLDLEKEEGAGKETQEAGAGIRLVTTVEHYGLTDIEWDPSGRYVATYGSMWMSTVSRSLFQRRRRFGKLIIRFRLDGSWIYDLGFQRTIDSRIQTRSIQATLVASSTSYSPFSR
jgi:hypothetical protein